MKITSLLLAFLINTTAFATCKAFLNIHDNTYKNVPLTYYDYSEFLNNQEIEVVRTEEEADIKVEMSAGKIQVCYGRESSDFAVFISELMVEDFMVNIYVTNLKNSKTQNFHKSGYGEMTERKLRRKFNKLANKIKCDF